MILDRFFQQQNLDTQENSAGLNRLLQSLQQNTSVQIFDQSLKQSLNGGPKQGGSGCGGGCCG
jgi:hypothetical protein